MESRTIEIPSISCWHCTAAIERELKDIDGVVSVHSRVAEKQVSITWQPPATWNEILSLLVELSHPPAGPAG